jgi:hypothetical protein
LRRRIDRHDTHGRNDGGRAVRDILLGLFAAGLAVAAAMILWLLTLLPDIHHEAAILLLAEAAGGAIVGLLGLLLAAVAGGFAATLGQPAPAPVIRQAVEDRTKPPVRTQ